MNGARAVLIWAMAFLAFDIAHPPEVGGYRDPRTPAEVILEGLITPLEFVHYVLPSGPPTHVKCCGAWVPYPVPHRSTSCPGCGTEFAIRATQPAEETPCR